jgi:hypothetical protein
VTARNEVVTERVVHVLIESLSLGIEDIVGALTREHRDKHRVGDEFLLGVDFRAGHAVNHRQHVVLRDRLALKLCPHLTHAFDRDRAQREGVVLVVCL